MGQGRSFHTCCSPVWVRWLRVRCIFGCPCELLTLRFIRVRLSHASEEQEKLETFIDSVGRRIACGGRSVMECRRHSCKRANSAKSSEHGQKGSDGWQTFCLGVLVTQSIFMQLWPWLLQFSLISCANSLRCGSWGFPLSAMPSNVFVVFKALFLLLQGLFSGVQYR